MRIFVSYAHNDPSTRLVERVRRDLHAAGHETWIDEEQIGFSEDWRQRITEGIKRSDWVIAFLSRRALREKGVCLDELAIAMEWKPATLMTVLVEDPQDVAAPPTIAHLQWLDMQGWAAREAEGDEAWFADRRDTLLAHLRDPAKARFSGEFAELEAWLRPVPQGAEIADLLTDFTGREWLIEKIQAWRRGDFKQRLFWLAGPPGTGKSAASARLAHHGEANTISLNLCRFNIEDRRNPARIVRTLAFQLARRLGDYRARLLSMREADKDGAELARLSENVAGLFDWLVIQPLHRSIDGGRSADRLLILIDALDETSDADGHCLLADVLADAARYLPDWIGLVVTSRTDGPIESQLGGFPQIQLAAEDTDRDDLAVYTRAWLKRRGLAGPALERKVGDVVAASGDRFLYLRKFREAVESGEMALDAPEGLPRDLAGLYARWFKHRFADVAAYERDVLPLLEVILAAELPVPEPVLDGVFGWDSRARAKALHRLRSLFERRRDGVAPFHKSLRDWLLDERQAGPQFVVAPASGRARLADFLATRFAESDAPDPDAFTLFELPRLLSTAGGRPALSRLADGARPQAVIERAVAVAQAAAAAYEWSRARDWWALAIAIGRSAGDAALDWLRFSLVELGDMERILGDVGAAMHAYGESLSVAERLTAQDPRNAEWQRDLSISHNKIGYVLQAQGDGDGALDAYRASLAIRERLAAQDPRNAEWQRDLSISHNRIGDVKRAQGDGDGALDAYRASLAISERLAAQDPRNAEWQRDLSVSHDRIGDVLQAQGDGDGALDAFRASLAIRERLSAQDPRNAGWQRDLSVSHDKIGDVKRAQGDGDGALDAYRASLAIRERLAAQDPRNAEWQRDLSISHDRIGDVKRAQGDGDGALDAYRASLAIRERLAAQDPRNAGWQRDLSISHNNIGDVKRAQGDGDGALDAYRASLAIRERLAAQDPRNAEWQRDLSISHDRIGDVKRAQGDGDGALDAYRASLAIRERLAAQDPRNAGWQRDLSISHNNIGDVKRAQGDGDGALDAYRADLAIAERLAAQDPRNAEWQRDLSISHDRIGDVKRAQGDGDGALDAYRASLAIAERLAAQDPRNAQWQRDLSISHNRIGDVLQAQGDGDGALDAFRAGLAIAERLAAQDPRNAGWQRDLSISHTKIGDVKQAQGDGDGALAAYRASLAIGERLAAQDPRNAEWQRDLSISHTKIGDVKRAQGDGDGALDAYRASLAIGERLAAQDPRNAEWQRDLVLSVGRIGDVLTQQRDREALAWCRRAQDLATSWAARFPQGNGRELLDWTDRLVTAAEAVP